MIEVGLVFDVGGRPICWFTAERPAYIEDSPTLWQTIWEHRSKVAGVAHTHPWSGAPAPSMTDLTTFAAIEAALGKRLVWPIVTMDKVATYSWEGPERLSYVIAEISPLSFRKINRLRFLSAKQEKERKENDRAAQ